MTNPTFDPQMVRARLDADYRPPVIHATHNPFPPRNWYQAKADLTAALKRISELEAELNART